jgi:hypothetical protein
VKSPFGGFFIARDAWPDQRGNIRVIGWQRHSGAREAEPGIPRFGFDASREPAMTDIQR